MGKRLGQHFLKNPEVSRRIVEALNLQRGDRVIEVGAGRGALTRELLQNISSGGLIAIEKDLGLAQQLARNFQFLISNVKSIPNVQMSKSQNAVIHGDALRVLPFLDAHWKLDIACLPARQGNWKLAGNIPYYITGKLFRVIGELEHKPEIIVLMIQKEVAERVSAKPPKMNLLAASVQAWAEAEVLFSVSREEFRPMPKVESAVVRLKIKDKGLRIKDEYYKLIKILFKQPRKTIFNNLSAGFSMPKEELRRVLRDADINPSLRPQTLSVELITKLARMLYNR